MRNVGENIKSARRKAGITQTKLAEKAGISLMSVRRYENGERIPNIETIQEIADALDVDFWDIVGIDTARNFVNYFLIDGDVQLSSILDIPRSDREVMSSALEILSAVGFLNCVWFKYEGEFYLISDKGAVPYQLDLDTAYKMVRTVRDVVGSIVDLSVSELLDADLHTDFLEADSRVKEYLEKQHIESDNKSYRIIKS